MNNNDKIKIFFDVFKGRGDAYGTGAGCCVKKTLSANVLLNHLKGVTRVGMYPLAPEILDGAGVYWACLDIDIDDFNLALEAVTRLDQLGVKGYIERSKSKGYHIWVFFGDVIHAKKARVLLRYANADHEIFPKQDNLEIGGYGNYVNLPLFGVDLVKGKTVFIDETSRIYQDQWSLLKGIEKVYSKQIDDLFDLGELKLQEPMISQEIIAAKNRNIKKLEKIIQDMGIKAVKPEPETPSEFDRYMSGELVNGSRTETLVKLCGHWYGCGMSEDAAIEIGHSLDDKFWGLDSDVQYQNQYKGMGKVEGTIRDIYSRNRKQDQAKLAKLAEKPAVDTTGNISFNLTDMGNGERLAHYYGNKIRYCNPQKTWYIWTGKLWEADKGKGIEKLAKNTVRKMYIEAGACDNEVKRKAIADHARRSENRNRVDSMIYLAQSEPGIPIMSEELDADPWLLNCINGVIDLKTGELLPHRPQNLMTKIVPVEYIHGAKLQLWDEFLNTATNNDQEMIAFLQRAVGYSLTGKTGEEKIFFVYGRPGTGKSTFMDAIRTILGPYSTTADFEMFIKKYGNHGAREDLAALSGARLVSSIEVAEGKVLAENLVAWVTGGDIVRARFLYQNGFEYIPQFKLWMVANHAPKIRDTDSPIWRRIMRIPFDHIIPEKDRDPEVKETLKNPEIAGSAILAWAVEGCLRWQEYGLGSCEKVKQSTDEYKKETNVIEAFIDECCLIDENTSCTKNELYEVYKKWALDSGEFVETKIQFGRRLLDTMSKIKSDLGTGATKVWKGIGVIAKE